MNVSLNFYADLHPGLPCVLGLHLLGEFCWKRMPEVVHNPVVDAVELTEVNPDCVYIFMPDSRGMSVSMHHLAPPGELPGSKDYVTDQPNALP